MFNNSATGILVPIFGNDRTSGEWEHRAFLANPIVNDEPVLTAATYRQVSRARAALAALDATARLLPNPSLLRRPTLNREAQSTSALEGTYAPLSDVLDEDEDAPSSMNLREVFNYIVMADHAFYGLQEGRSLTLGFLASLQATLVRGTPSEGEWSGKIRGIQVVIGLRPEAARGELPVKAARFVPAPPGQDLEARVRDLLDWMSVDHSQTIDPVVAVAIAHYQFETLHPFHDGNGRLGRLLIVMNLMMTKVLSEPTLTVSPWFESRRTEYYDRLFAVSCRGQWDEWIEFFARGIEQSALDSRTQMLALLHVQTVLREEVRSSSLRADNAQKLVDVAVARPSFTARQVSRDLNISYGRANNLIGQLVNLDILEPVKRSATYDRRFRAPRVHEVILRTSLS